MIYIHVGLPKTGTTALQKHFFPNLKNTRYLGVEQPRDTANSNIYKVFQSYSIGGITYEDAARAIRQEVKDPSERLALSEEMFTVSSHGVTWVEKLERVGDLAKLFDDFKIIVTTREPAEASLSYYIECYDKLLKANETTWPQAVKHSLEMKIYHYDYLMGALQDYFYAGQLIVLKYADIFDEQKDPMGKIFEEKIKFISTKENVTDKEPGMICTKQGTKIQAPSEGEINEVRAFLESDSRDFREFMNKAS
nr:sulfotransferase [uncultured Halomonas sp.]